MDEWIGHSIYQSITISRILTPSLLPVSGQGWRRIWILKPELCFVSYWTNARWCEVVLNSTHRVLGHALVRPLICSHHSLICLLSTACFALLDSFVHSLPIARSLARSRVHGKEGYVHELNVAVLHNFNLQCSGWVRPWLLWLATTIIILSSLTDAFKRSLSTPPWQ